MTPPHDFGELRSLLATTPSARAFDAVLDLVEAALPVLGEGAYMDRWAPYLEARLERWPDATRRVRGERLKALERAPAPWGPLVRTLEYSTSTISESRCASICAAEHLAGVTQLDLRGATTSYGVLHQLAAGAPFVLDSFGLRKSTSSGAKPADLIPLFSSRMLSRLSSLELTGWSRFGATSVMTLIEHLPLEHMRRLDLHDTGIGKSGLAAILKCEDLAGLEWLDLGRVEFGAKQIEALVDATHLRNLQHLCLSHTSFDPSAIGDVAAAPHLIELASLDLGSNRLDADDMRALCAPDLYPNLRALRFRDALSPEALGVLLASGCFSAVTALELSDVALDAGAIQAASGWPALASLTLRDDVTSLEAWRALARSSMCEGLSSLVVERLGDVERSSPGRRWGYGVVDEESDAFMSAALEVPLPSTLEHLGLPSNRLREVHVAPILAQPCAPNLRSLDLSSTVYRFSESLGDGLRQITESPDLGNLRALSLHTTPEDQPALEALVTSERLPELRLLELTPSVSRERIARLSELAPSRLRARRQSDDE